MNLTYQNAINLLTSQSKFHISLGLNRTEKILSILGNPQNKVKIIHVAGTNGKGSVSSVLANILKSAGYKTGLYTSPHLVEYTERIKINNLDISKQDFANYIDEICLIADNNKIDLTEFEILTVCAFLYFYRNKIDVAIIETGLGGRFDATNTAKNKLLSIITSISLDHTDRLGNTIEEIAYEKAGIIEKNSNVIISNENLGFNKIKEVALSQNAKVHIASNNIKTAFESGNNYLIIDNQKYEFSLLGLYQNKNMSLVISAVEFLNNNGFKIDENAIRTGFKTAKWSARLEYRKKQNLLIDGAHNPDAAIELRKSLDYYFKGQKRLFIYSTINTKDFKSIAKILFQDEDEIYFYEFNHKNAVSYSEYIQNVDWLNIKKFEADKLKDILASNKINIITGSLYMIGEIYPKLPL